jgi:hypothetical protein
MTTTKLICPECRHENEAERIYCHNCGSRLDRSAVRVKKEPVDDTRKRVKRMFDPQRAKLRALSVTISKLILGACAVATLIQMALPPDVPAPVKTPMLASQIRFDLENMSAKHQPPQVQYTEDQANAFLGTTLRTKQASLNKPLLEFKRALVGFGENSCTVRTERSFFGYSLYTSCTYSVNLSDGDLVASNKGGSIGRLQIHPKIAKFMGVLFADVWSALDHDIKLVTRLGAAEFHDKNVLLTAPAP